MIVGVGTDITTVSRFERIIEKNARFAAKILTPSELSVYNDKKGMNQLQYLAGRFAVKEAVAKAFGTGIGELNFKHIECLNNELGAPIVNVINDRIDSRYHSLMIHVSISHNEDQVVAFVVIEEECVG